ncbi:MAG TPA: hypothetical protein VH309_06085 [Elusimicrobiota bacterium]|jgi:hypothetical protein|nr:hypothetical protein [Elusimicrobiota bacterium]
MSISAHLTPEPERRLTLILENMRAAGDRADLKIGALTAFAAAELTFTKILAPAGALGFLTVVSLAAALPLGVFAFAPLARLPKLLSFLDEEKHKTSVNDCLLAVEDLAKYTQTELVNRLDRYLGGGITATPYYEDIVGQIVASASVAARKRRLFRASCALVGFAQLCLFALTLWR